MDVGSRLANGYEIGSRFQDDFDITLVPKAPTKSRSICFSCSYLGDVNKNGKLVCKAFPNGIPDVFLTAKADHTSPYDGDNGITFQP